MYFLSGGQEEDWEEATRRKLWVLPYFNKSGELCSFIVTWELDYDSEKYRSFYTGKHTKVLNFSFL
jgi:hypothetical protein